MSKVKTTLLWIAVPFAAILAMFIGNILGQIIQYWCLNWIIIGDGGLKDAISDIVGELIAGVCFVMAGTAVAPSYKKTVSIVLATIVCTISIIAIIHLVINNFTLMKLFGCLASVLGAIIYAIEYNEDK